MRHLIAVGLCLGWLAVCASGQKSVEPIARYHRLIALVHINGSGKEADPILPEYVPSAAATASRSGIIAWSMQMTDDKAMAIVQFVAIDRSALAAILADKRPDVKVFEIGKDSADAINAEMRKHKKDFDLASFEVAAQ